MFTLYMTPLLWPMVAVALDILFVVAMLGLIAARLIFWPIGVFMGAMAVIWLFTGILPMSEIPFSEYPLFTVMLVATYIAIGVLYSGYVWYKLVKEAKPHIDVEFDKFVKNRLHGPATESEKWEKFVAYEYAPKLIKPRGYSLSDEYNNLIVTNMIYWPVLGIANLIIDLVINFGSTMLKLCGGFYAKLTKIALGR